MSTSSTEAPRVSWESANVFEWPHSASRSSASQPAYRPCRGCVLAKSCAGHRKRHSLTVVPSVMPWSVQLPSKLIHTLTSDLEHSAARSGASQPASWRGVNRKERRFSECRLSNCCDHRVTHSDRVRSQRRCDCKVANNWPAVSYLKSLPVVLTL